MAQGAVAFASLPVNGTGTGAALTADELREILEYDRIVQFRDAVLAGTHPRVKIPAHLIGKPVAPPLDLLSTHIQTSSPHGGAVAQPAAPTLKGQSDNTSTTSDKISHASSRSVINTPRSEINPILLEKSDHLIRAEIQLQRRNLERALREQIEQQRIAAKAALQTSESLPDFDLSEVLSKALAIVQSSVQAEVAAPGDAHSSASDSFDERTFYSSQHDTPMSSSSQGQHEPNGVQTRATLVSPNGRQSENHSADYGRDSAVERDVILSNSATAINSNAADLRENGKVVTPSSISHSSANSTRQPLSFTASQNAPVGSSNFASRSAIDLNTPPQVLALPRHQQGQTVVQRTNQELLSQAFDDSRPSPLIRAHNLSLHAPQPARVSPLVTVRDIPLLREDQINDGAQPAQVAALRNVASGLSSTDSSPRASKVSKKKKKDKSKGKGKEKEKKRKAKDAAPASPDSPYIKPEPHSPEPFSTQLPRPQKRPRHSGQFSAGLTYDEPEILHGQPAPARQLRTTQDFQRNDARYESDIAPRPAPVYRAEHGRNGSRYVDRVDSPLYAANLQAAAQPMRAASYATIDRRVVDEPRYIREQVSRASVRPELDHERSRSPIFRAESSVRMAPPRRPMRIVLDEFGNEYLEPIPTMAPPPRYREPELLYERAPSRAVSARMPVEAYDEGGIVYRRASPLPARRVVTQPEYAVAPPDHRVYRQREYSVHPPTGGEEFVQIRAPERRPVAYFDEPVRELTRAPSVRPEAIRYELPREYPQRMQSVRPEGALPREYATSVHPDVRREVQHQPIREYSVRPEVPLREYASSVRPDMRREAISAGQREYSVRPVETLQRREYLPAHEGQYYEEAPLRRPTEISYIERPRQREGSVMVYADNVRREVYR